MEFFRKTNIQFIENRKLFYSISGLLFLISIISFATKGLKFGIDFTGGLLMQVSFDKPVETGEIRSVLGSMNFTSTQIQKISGANTFIIKLQSEQDITPAFVENVKKVHADINVTVDRMEMVGPAVGRWLIEKAAFAFIFSFLGIIIYVGIRFKGGVWGITGVIALVHDVFITTGFLSLTGREINLTVIASLLTLVGYSINDTIVIFDRIRENLRLRYKEEQIKIFNGSVNDTLSRSVLTSFTVFLVVATLYLLGSEPIRDFSFAMLFGVVIGSYSSIYVAAAMVYEWKMRKKSK